MLRETIAQRAETLREALATTLDHVVVSERASGAFVFAWTGSVERLPYTRAIYWLDEHGTRLALREVRHAA